MITARSRRNARSAREQPGGNAKPDGQQDRRPTAKLVDQRCLGRRHAAQQQRLGSDLAGDQPGDTVIVTGRSTVSVSVGISSRAAGISHRL